MYATLNEKMMKTLPIFDSTPYWVKKHNEIFKMIDKLQKKLFAKIDAFEKEGTNRFWNDDHLDEPVKPKLKLAKHS